MPEIIATLAILYRPSALLDWEEKQRIPLTLPTVRIGRGKDNDIMIDVVELRQGYYYLVLGMPTREDFKLFATIKDGHYISRRHATMFKWDDATDYEIMDGSPGVATLDNPNAEPVLSACGVIVNSYKLDPGIKQILKDRDEIHFIKGILKMVYLRPQNKIVDAFDDTYIPEFADTKAPTEKQSE